MREKKPYSKNKIKWNPQEQLCGEKRRRWRKYEREKSKETVHVFSIKKLKLFLHKYKNKKYWAKNSGPMQQTFSAKKKKLWAQNNFITPLKLGIDVFHSQLGMQKLKSGWR